MNEGRNWSSMGVATWVAWATVATLIVAMWVAMAVGHDSIGVALGFTACASSAAAAALHVRQFICRTQRMVRTLLVRDTRNEGEGLNLVP